MHGGHAVTPAASRCPRLFHSISPTCAHSHVRVRRRAWLRLPQGLPEGFFDDPELDAKVRGVEARRCQGWGGGQGRLGGEGRQAAGRSGKPEEGRQGGGWQAEGRATAR